ncbi:MAG: tetratricopeptide repeat protein [Bacteroidales bacterium]
MKKIPVFIIFIFLSFFGWGQNIHKLSTTADTYFQEGNYSYAIDYYEKIIEYEANLPSIYIHLGKAYFYNLQYDDALRVLSTLVHDYDDEYPEAYFWLGEINSLLGNEHEAKKNYTLFLSLSSHSHSFREKAEYEINKSRCSESSSTHITITKDRSIEFIQQYGFYIYKHMRLYNGILEHNDSLLSPSQFVVKQNSRNVSTVLSDSLYHISDFCPIHSDTVLITMREKNNKNARPSTFFISLDNNKWHNPVLYNNPILPHTYTSIHFFFDTIGGKEFLFFSSDRPGGYGGLDIWISERENGVFQEPFNAGSAINTKGDEISPFYYKHTNTLYFSSNRHSSIGGFDVFLAQDSSLVFKNSPQNIGSPINTSFNEYYYKIINDSAYFCSNKSPVHIDESNFYYNSLYFYSTKSNKQNDDTIISTTPNITKDTNMVCFLYFASNKPTPCSAESYTSLFNSYLRSKPLNSHSHKDSLSGIKQKVYTQSTSSFYNTAQQNFDTFSAFLNYSISQFPDNYSLSITLRASTSATGSSEFNTIVARERINTIQEYIYSHIPKKYYSYISLTILPADIKKSLPENTITRPIQNAQNRYVKVTASLHYSSNH